MRYPATPDGRYFVVRGRLWRCSNPSLSPDVRERLVANLMRARRQKGVALRAGNKEQIEMARLAIDEAKHQLGERGEVWWTDGAPDFDRKLVRNTPYAEWFSKLEDTE